MTKYFEVINFKTRQNEVKINLKFTWMILKFHEWIPLLLGTRLLCKYSVSYDKIFHINKKNTAQLTHFFWFVGCTPMLPNFGAGSLPSVSVTRRATAESIFAFGVSFLSVCTCRILVIYCWGRKFHWFLDKIDAEVRIMEPNSWSQNRNKQFLCPKIRPVMKTSDEVVVTIDTLGLL